MGLKGLAYSLTYSEEIYLYILGFLATLVIGSGNVYYHPLRGAIIHENSPSKFLGKAIGINRGMGNVGRAISIYRKDR